MKYALCDGCKKRAWVNSAFVQNVCIGLFCAECWEGLDVDDDNAATRSGVRSTPNQDPGFDNVIRAMEEDR